MRVFKVYIKQDGEGCDYTIGCGNTLVELKSTDIEVAKVEVLKFIERSVKPNHL